MLDFINKGLKIGKNNQTNILVMMRLGLWSLCKSSFTLSWK